MRSDLHTMLADNASARDLAEAERFIRETYEDNPSISRVWIENNRPQLLRYAMQAVKQKREHLEHKARFAPAKRRAA